MTSRKDDTTDRGGRTLTGLMAIRAAEARANDPTPEPLDAPARGSSERGMLIAATVTTPDTPQPPNNYIVTALDACTSIEDVETVRAHALRHGYSREGQTVKRIEAKLAELTGGDTGNDRLVRPTKSRRGGTGGMRR